MYRYILRRLIYVIPMLLGISSLSFFIMQMAPGDALTTMALSPDVTDEIMEAMRARFWLDQPLQAVFPLGYPDVQRRYGALIPLACPGHVGD